MQPPFFAQKGLFGQNDLTISLFLNQMGIINFNGDVDMSFFSSKQHVSL
jgi:hypothetical protein